MTGILDKESLNDDAHHDRPPSCQVEASHQTNIGHHIASAPIKRDISGLNMIATAFNICNSWVACATTLAIAISAGGTFTVIYGVIVVGSVYICVAMTLAELASVYPTSGGQYHFTYILAPGKLRRGLSYLCGVAATCSWVFLAAGVTILASQVLLALAAFYNESYDIKDWHYFLVFQAINLVLHIYNIFLLKKTLWIHEVGFILSLVFFVVISVTCLARSDKAPSSFVWNYFVNNAGWPDGITFLTGLITPAAMFLGLDGAMHLADEALTPQKAVPKALMSTSIIGFSTAFIFSIAMCYSISDLDALANVTMPVYALWRQATRNDTAATVFLVFLFFTVLFAINAIMQTASRMTWAFAMDGALIGSRHLSGIHPSLQVPVWSYLFNGVIVALLGCIYLGSTMAFDAIMGTSIILQMISFSMPAALVMIRKRSPDVLPPDRFFKLPNWLGWCVNTVVVCFSVIELIFFTFPATNPTTGSAMNYASVVLAIAAIFAIINWAFYARKHFDGPTMDLSSV